MSDDDDNVVDIRRNRKLADVALDAALIHTFEEFRQLMIDHRAVSFAAVAVTASGEVIDTWFTAVPNPALIGAVEMLKHDFIMHTALTTEDIL